MVKAVCPNCGYKMDASESVGEKGNQPSAGDVGICIRCVALCTYKDNGDGSVGLRFPTEEEALAYAEDDKLMRTVANLLRYLS